MDKTLSIIGCGHVGKALGRLWQRRQTVTLGQILNSSPDSARNAAAFIGAGQAIGSYAQLRPADLYLLAVPDDLIAECCGRLADTGLLGANSVVFHCSGALDSGVLQAAKERGAAVASVHPIRSFASPQQVVQTFNGTWCGTEGDEMALPAVEPLFTDIGARTVRIDPQFKILYHAAAVFASNYLVTLLDIAEQAYQKAGMRRDEAHQVIEPLVRSTVDNFFLLGAEKALSGPIARGDVTTVERQYQAVLGWDEARGSLYSQFADLTTELARRRSESGD